MDFALSDEQRMFTQMFADFVAKEIAPHAEEIDHERTLPAHMLRSAAEQGFLGAMLPEEYFGADLDYLSYALLIEALAGKSVSVAVTVATHVSMVAMSILEHGDDAQKQAWLTAMADGDTMGAFAFTEPDAGCDDFAVQTRAAAETGGFVLDGVKTCVSNGQMAGVFLIFAMDQDGLEAFLVPRDTPGLSVGYREPTLGLHSTPFNTIYLERCRLPTGSRLGHDGEGTTIARQARDRMGVALAAAGLGVARSSLEVASQFATERVQFGGPVAQKQAVQNLVAKAFIEVEALRYLVYRTAWLADQGAEYSVESSIAKAYASEVARRTTNSMVQVMGGYGYMEDYPMARKYRDARMLGIIGGPTEVHHVEVARQLFGKLGLEIAP